MSIKHWGRKFAIFFAIVVAIVLRFSPIEKQVGEAPLPKVEESLKSEQVKKEVGLSVTSLSTDTLELDDHAERFFDRIRVKFEANHTNGYSSIQVTYKMDEHLEPDLDALDEMQLQSMRYNVKNDSVTKREVLDSDLFDIRWDGEKNEFTLSTDQLELLGKFYEAEEGYVRYLDIILPMRIKSEDVVESGTYSDEAKVIINGDEQYQSNPTTVHLAENPKKNINITARVHWQSELKQAFPMVVEFHRRTDEGRDEIVKKKIFRVKNPVTIAKDAREYTWKDMPRLDDEGHLYVYYVKVLKIGNDVVRDGLAGDIVVKEKGLNIMNSIKEKTGGDSTQ